jgi:signal transduction histidine kinase
LANLFDAILSLEPMAKVWKVGEQVRRAQSRRLTTQQPPPAELEADGLGRYPVEVESAVYFCCVEALQNAAKHAGPVARVSLSLREMGKRLQFEISDSGPGFQVGQGAGAGLANMRDRLGAVGGSLAIESSPARGTVVRGEVPLPSGPSIDGGKAPESR